MRGLHRQCHAYTERRERNHWRRPDTDKYHLPKDRRNFEKLPRKGRNQNPVEQAEVKSEVVFQSQFDRAE